MLQSEIEIGKTYVAKVGTSLTVVKVLMKIESRFGRPSRYSCENLKTGRAVLMTAAKLRTAATGEIVVAYTK